MESHSHSSLFDTQRRRHRDRVVRRGLALIIESE